MNDRVRYRLQSKALQETEPILKGLKKQYPQLKHVRVRFDDQPDRKMIDSGLPVGAESTYVEPDIVLFLFNIYETNREAADYRSRIRRVLLREIGDLVGEDLTAELED